MRTDVLAVVRRDSLFNLYDVDLLYKLENEEDFHPVADCSTEVAEGAAYISRKTHLHSDFPFYEFYDFALEKYVFDFNYVEDYSTVIDSAVGLTRDELQTFMLIILEGVRNLDVKAELTIHFVYLK